MKKLILSGAIAAIVAVLLLIIYSILYLLFGLLQVPTWEGTLPTLEGLIFIIPLLALLSSIVCSLGFFAVGRKYQKSFLSFMSALAAIFGTFFLILQVAGIDLTNISTSPNRLFYVILILLIGISGVLVSFALLSLRKNFGVLALWTGILGIIYGCIYSVNVITTFGINPPWIAVFYFLLLLFGIPAFVLESKLLFRAAKS